MLVRDSFSESISPVLPSYKTFELLGIVSNSRFPSYQVLLEQNYQDYAMKIFYHNNERISKYYENESRFLRLKHQNVLRLYSKEDSESAEIDNHPRKFSYILLELAPHKDLAHLAVDHHLYKSEKIVRTFFHQLINGLQFLHSNNIYHMDLKLESLLIGRHFQLKIADFECAYKERDYACLGNGTPNYRAPERRDRNFSSPASADIYSAGIILFVLLIGHYPYSEKASHTEMDYLWEFMLNEDSRFWKLHMKRAVEPKNLSESFKKLFMSMTKKNPSQRISLKDVKKSEWFLGPVYADGELELLMQKILAE